MPRRRNITAALWSALAVALGVMLWAGQGAADPVPKGVIFRDSPHPSVFPLVINAPAGQGFVITLRAADSGDHVLSAGFAGGAPYRLLVPQGAYRLRVAYGQDWTGARFAPGPESGAVDIATPLRFAVSGIGRKQGHVLHLTRADTDTGAATGAPAFDVAIRGQALCQRVISRYIRPEQGQRWHDLPRLGAGGALIGRRLDTPDQAARAARDVETGRAALMPYIDTATRTVVCD